MICTQSYEVYLLLIEKILFNKKQDPSKHQTPLKSWKEAFGLNLLFCVHSDSKSNVAKLNVAKLNVDLIDVWFRTLV